MGTNLDQKDLVIEIGSHLKFVDLLDLDEIQHFQDLFAEVNGVASVITHPDGTPITRPSRFTRFCTDIIRGTEQGCLNDQKPTIEMGMASADRPILNPCPLSGLCFACSGITVDGQHIGNWFIGQVRSEELDKHSSLTYPSGIGANSVGFFEAFDEVPMMSVEKFSKVADLLSVFSKELSEKANNSLQLKKQVAELNKALKRLKENEKKYSAIFENTFEVFYQTDLAGNILDISPSIRYLSEFKPDELIGTSVYNLYSNPCDREIFLNAITKNGVLSDYGLKLKTKTGEIRYVSINVRLIYGLDGRPSRVDGAIRDITDRKLAENSLKESEEKYRLLFAGNPQPMWIYDLETLAFLEVNQAAVYHYGYTGEEFLSMKIKDIRPVEDIDALVINVALEHETYSLSGTWRHVKKNGEIIQVEITSHPITFNDRKARHVMINDITEQKRVEKELVESRQQLLDIIDFLPDATFVVDNEKKVIAWNKAMEEMTGVQKLDIIGKGDHEYAIPFYGKRQNLFLDLIDNNDLELRARYSNIGKKGLSIQAEIFAPHLYNDIGAYISVLGAPLLNDKGVRIGCIESIRDVTDRKKAEEALMKLNKAINTSGEAIFMTDREGIFTFINPAFTALYGFKADEIVGKTTPRVFKSGLVDQSGYENFWTTLLEGNEVRGELINKRRNGALIDIDGSATPIFDEEKTIIGFLGIQRDITQRKQAEQELIAAKEKAEESDRLKSAFLANMSHEVRTPLNSIIGFSELLADPYFEQEQKDEFVHHIVTNGNQLLTIISDIMDISKIESGEIAMRRSQVNARKFILTVKERFLFQAVAKKLKFKLSLPDTPEETIIFTDADRLHQIFNNLINNALKFTEKGQIEIGYQSWDNRIEFYVRDTGIGISEEYHKKIFDRFRQVEDAKTRTYGGNGLGLAISKNLVELMGGKIWVKSEPGKGSTFYFTVPCE